VRFKCPEGFTHVNRSGFVHGPIALEVPEVDQLVGCDVRGSSSRS
jgi:hypothetical protein